MSQFFVGQDFTRLMAWSPLPSSLAVTEFTSLWLYDSVSNRKDSTDTPWYDLAIEKCKNHHLILLVTTYEKQV